MAMHILVHTILNTKMYHTVYSSDIPTISLKTTHRNIAYNTPYSLYMQHQNILCSKTTTLPYKHLPSLRYPKDELFSDKN